MRLKSTLTLVVICVALQPATAAEIQRAKGEVVLDSATDHVEPMHSSSGDHPGRDVASLRIASDGTNISLTATLTADASGTMASDVVRVFVDTDNDSSTGETATWSSIGGFELVAKLSLCIKYEGGAEACSGGAGSVATDYFAVATVEDTATGQSEKAFWDLPTTPVEGKVVESTVPYSDLSVKPGQTVRIYARESSGPYDESGYFPQVALTLK